MGISNATGFLVKQLGLAVKDFRAAILEIPRTKYQFWYKAMLVAMVVFIVTMLFLSIWR